MLVGGIVLSDGGGLGGQAERTIGASRRCGAASEQAASGGRLGGSGQGARQVAASVSVARRGIGGRRRRPGVTSGVGGSAAARVGLERRGAAGASSRRRGAAGTRRDERATGGPGGQGGRHGDGRCRDHAVSSFRGHHEPVRQRPLRRESARDDADDRQCERRVNSACCSREPSTDRSTPSLCTSAA